MRVSTHNGFINVPPSGVSRLTRTTAVDAFGKIGNGKCPKLGSDTEQMEYLTGLLTSVQAVLSDIRAGSSVGVPQDIAARAGRATHWSGQ